MESLVSFGCKNCGSPHLRDRADGKLECLSCRRVFEKNVETSAEREARILYLSRLDDAEKHLRISPPEFDKAESLFRDFIDFYPKNSDGYWGLVRARYGIKYERDIRGVDIPSCYKSSYKDFREDTDFKKALEFAENASTYENLTEQAELIAGVCKKWYDEAKNYSYDIFISFKATDDKTGDDTLDIEDMKELHSFLLEEGYNVFFSPRSMRRYQGQHYDAYIFNALQTAKAMIVYGSKPEYFTSTWVQNEWTRFLRMEAKGEKKPGSCIVAHKGFSPYELPPELRRIQAIDASEENRFYFDVLKSIKRILEEEKKIDTNEELMREIAELRRQQEENQKANQKQLEESRKQQEALEKSLEEEKKKNSKKPNTISEEARTPETAATIKVNQATKKAEVFNPDFEIVDGCLKKYKGKKAEVVIPDGVVEIGERAFYVPEYYPAIVKSIVIPRSVKTIGSYAFGNVHGLTSITLPDSIKTINSYAFNNCSGLTSITIPDSVTSIGSHTFDGCSNLKSITIGNSVTNIGSHMFNGCSGLNNITIGNSVCSIGENAFLNCSNLINIVIPNSVRTIGNDAFQRCKNLKSITIPDSVKTIGKYAFSGCSSLSQIKISNYIKTIGEGTFAWCSSLTDFVIPDSVKTIGVAAFTGCNNLKNISIPNSVTTLGNSAFSKCDSLNDVIIPNSVKLIGSFAFSECTGLTRIVIPKSVTNIGSNAFSHCNSLTIWVDDLEQTEKWTANWNPDNRPVKVIEKTASVVAGKASSSQTNVTPTAAVAKKEVSKPDPDFVIVDGCLKKYYGKKAEVVIPDGVTSIKGGFLKGAFRGCKTVTKVIIPDSVTSIGEWAFSASISLIIVDENNQNYKSIDGNLYTKDGTTLVQYATSKKDASFVIPSSVTNIASHAFSNCKSLANVTIPDSVTSIGSDAFYNTAYYNDESNWVNGVLYIGNHLIKTKETISGEYVIKDGTITISPFAFSHCSNLSSIIIPNSVTTIGYAALSGCSSLTSITIPDSVISISDLVFSNSSSLTNITVDKNNKIYKSLDGNLYTKDGTTLIRYATGKKDTSFTIPDSVISINDYAFNGCSSLTSITIPDSVTSIGDDAFYNCSSLTSITIPDNVASIGEWALYKCSSLTSITIPDSVTTINSNAFRDCGSLTIYVNDLEQTKKWDPNWNPDNRPVKVIEKTASVVAGKTSSSKTNVTPTAAVAKKEVSKPDPDFEIVDGCLKKYKGNKAEVVIPDGVTSIGESAFEKCETITTVIIPNSVTSIGDVAFFGCTMLNVVKIPNSVTSIGIGAFAYCKRLSGITIPDSVTSINGRAFHYCYSLTSITIPASVEKIGLGAFERCEKLSSANFKDTKGWLCDDQKNIALLLLGNKTIAAKYLTSKFVDCIWTKMK